MLTKPLLFEASTKLERMASAPAKIAPAIFCAHAAGYRPQTDRQIHCEYGPEMTIASGRNTPAPITIPVDFGGFIFIEQWDNPHRV